MSRKRSTDGSSRLAIIIVAILVTDVLPCRLQYQHFPPFL
jgi:hypothetical protein